MRKTWIGSIAMTLVTFALGFSVSLGAQDLARTRATEVEPQYLIFQLGTENRDFEVLLPEIKAEFGVAPAGSPRYVGFGDALLTLKTPIEELRRQVTRALNLAEETGLPVLIKLDDMNFTPEYTDPFMVEWTGFPNPGEAHGPPAKHYWLNWGSWMALPPPPNFESTAFRREVERRLKEGILPQLLERLARWKELKRTHLFAGVCLGWESGIPEYRPLRQAPVLPRDEQRQITMTEQERGEQLGYASLYARGWTRQKIQDKARQTGKSEEDVTTELLFQVIHDYITFWTKMVHDAGIPRESIYTHGVAWESVPERRLPGAWMRKSSRVPPIWVNVNTYSRPGYTVGAGQFEPEALVRLLRAAGATVGWGAVEAYVRGVESEASFGGYLRRLFDSGARMVDIFGWTAPGSPYDPKRAPGALRAMHVWLDGKELRQASAQATQPQGITSGVVPQSLQEKMERLRALVERRQQEGTNLQPVGELMQDFEPLMQQQKFSEAEALVDRALKLAGELAPRAGRPASGESSLIAYGARDVDGRQQIFVVKADGTGRRRLTQDGTQSFFPVWSRDGKRLAFTSDRSGILQIWVMDADGSKPTQLTTQGTNVIPAWSPDGKRLAFTSDRSGAPEIWVMGADGSHQKQLTTTTGAGISSAFAKLVALEVGFFGLNSPAGPGIINHFASWSPDGRRIVFCSTRSGYYAIWAMDSDGNRLTRLTTRYSDSFPHSNAPALSPDGRKIAFWSGVDLGPGQIWVMDADGGNRKQLTSQPASVNCDEPAWSPDGSKILFASNRPGSEGIGIWIMEADGSNQRVLITNTHEKSRVSWQPGVGTHQAADDWRERSLQQWTGQRLSSDRRNTDLKLPPFIRRLTYFGERADWSHDDKRLIFIEKTFGDVFEIELATGVIRPITHHYFHEGYTRALYLANGDILLSGAREFSAENPWVSRMDKAELWVLDKALDKPPTPLGERCFEGPAVSRSKMRIAWTVCHGNYPDQIPAGVCQFWIADVQSVNGRPTLMNKRKILDSSHLPFRLMETQNFRPPDEKELTFTAAYQGGDVMGLNLETGEIVDYTKTPGQFEEPEGIFPDGQFTTMESNRSEPGHNVVDIWKLKLDGSNEAERLTYFSEGHSGYRATNPVVSDDGRFMAFQLAKDGEPAGVGHGIFVYDFESAKKHRSR